MSLIRTILLVEDNPGDVDLIRMMLAETKAVSFNIISTQRLSESIERLKTDAIDLVLLDLGLPDSNGLDTFHRLNAEAPETPIIILTGNTSQEAAVIAVKEGAQDFLVKGQINGDLIVRAIRYALERKQAEDDIRRQEAITASINRVLQSSLKATADETMVRICLSEAETLTDSEFGWIGVVNQAGNLDVFTLCAPDAEFSGSKNHQPTPLQHTEINKIFNRLDNDVQSLLSNNPSTHPHLTDFVREYQDVTSFLCVSLRQEDTILGMIALANKPSGFTPVDKETIETLSVALIEALQHKRTEAERELLRTAIDQAGEAILITDTMGVIQYVNPFFEQITGYSKAEVIGKTPRILKSGQQDSTFYKDMWETISAGKTFQAHMINKRKDGSLFTEEATISPVWDAAGTIINYVAVKRDITEQLRLEAQSQHSQKLEAIGTLAGGIAHDFNNILTAILGYTELAKLEMGEQSKAGRDLHQVSAAAARAVELVKQILTISRHQQQQRQLVKIQNIITEVFKLLRPSITASIEIQSIVDHECPAVFADPTEVYQMVMNLCTNAFHAMRTTNKKGHIMAIGLKTIELSDTTVQNLGVSIAPGRYVNLTVSDTGCGIETNVMNKIFDPYFTTKKKGEGTGLGLATVHSIVSRCGGAISVESTIGKGTTFSLFLPAQKEASAGLSHMQDTKLSRQGTERIMVIDDEEPLAELLSRTLSRFGYQVSFFTSCQEAMSVFQDQPMAFDLIITDLNMPKILGTELAQEFLRIRPDIPIILCSGFSEKVDSENAKNIGIKKLLYKPVDKDTLSWVVRKILDGRASCKIK